MYKGQVGVLRLVPIMIPLAPMMHFVAVEAGL